MNLTNMKLHGLDQSRDRAAELARTRDDLLGQARAMLDTAEAEQRDLSAAERTEHEQLLGRIKATADDLADAEDRLGKWERLAGALRSGQYGLEPGTPYGRDDRPAAGGSTRDTAMRTLDAAVRSHGLPEYAAERVETMLGTGTRTEQDFTARWAVATGADAYRTAFAKILADPDRGHLLWTAEESDAYRAVADVQAAQRAMSLTDAAGGYMVPLTLDPAIILTNDGSVNPMRQLARVVRTATDAWSGVTSAGVSAEWIAEATEVAAVTPTLAQPTIPVHKGDAYTEFSFEVGGDAINFLSELQRLLVDAVDQQQATAFTVGTGSGQPTGIVTALAGGSSVVTGTGTEALAAADVFALQNALPPRFQPRAQWMAHLATINTLRQFETTNGALKFPELADGRLLGRAMHENSNMDGTLNAAATETNHVLLYGDFSQYVIVDRVGATLEIVQHVLGANRRPTGQRGALLWHRTGADAVVDGAFRMLNVPTTA